MEFAVKMILAISLVVLGLSHWLKHEDWRDFFSRLAEMGRPGAMINGMMHLWPGLIIVGFHRNYAWPDVLITLLGWAWVAKGALWLVFPELGLASMRALETAGPAKLKFVGVVMILIAALIGTTLMGRPAP